MNHHNGTARGIDYVERYQDAQVLQAADERREQRRERFWTPRIESPELDAVRDRMKHLDDMQYALGEWVSRLIVARDHWQTPCEVPEVRCGFDIAIGAVVNKRKAVRAEWEEAGVEFRKLGSGS